MPPTSRLSNIFLLGMAAMVSAVTYAQQESGYPVRAVRMVVPFPAGGGADFTARVFGQKMGESLRQTFVVDNRAGANGLLGTDLVAKSAPDGYTLLLVDRGALGINPSLYSKLPYDPLIDFEHLGIMADAPYVLVVNPSLPVQSVKDLIALAKAKPRSIDYGSFGIGSMAQLNFEALNQRHGIGLQHVAYKGASAAVSAVVAGEVGVAIASAPSLLGFIRSARLRALAVGADKRLGLLPNVPTMTEAGGGKDTLIPTFFALAAPARTPRAISTRLHAELKRAAASADIVDKLAANGLIASGSSPEAMQGIVAQDIAQFRVLAKSIGIKPE